MSCRHRQPSLTDLRSSSTGAFEEVRPSVPATAQRVAGQTTPDRVHTTPGPPQNLMRGTSRTAQRSRSINHSHEFLDHVIMAVDRTSKGYVGCAYFVAQEETMFCMQDIEDRDAAVLENLLLDLQPTIVLLTPRCELNNDSQHDQVRPISLLADQDDLDPLPYDRILRPPSEFDYETALSKLATASEIDIMPGDMRFIVPGDRQEFDGAMSLDDIGLTDQLGRKLNLSAWLDLSNRISIGCTGALVTHLQKRKMSGLLQDDPGATQTHRISRAEMFSIENVMLISTETLAALQIIQPESHPNPANQGPKTTGAKESFSVYGLFQHQAKTPQGKARLRQLFLRPSLDINTIRARHDFVSICVRPDNFTICSQLSKSLSKIKNLRPVVINLRKGVAGTSRQTSNIRSGVWSTLLEFCYHGLDIVDGLRQLAGIENVPLYTEVLRRMEGVQLQTVGKVIHDVVDMEETSEQRRTVIRRNVNGDLDKVKDMYAGMHDLLSQVAKDITHTMPHDIAAALSIVFLPQLGFHVAIPKEAEADILACEENTVWEQRFTTAAHLYLKNDKMREMDSELGDLWTIICDTEIEISHDLAQRILEFEEFLVRASDICGELDCILAIAHGAVRFNLTRPSMNETNSLYIQGGRHILQEVTVSSFIPNDTMIGGGSEDRQDSSGAPRMIIMTGPNYSGKSVYLKQVALIVYMAQIGSFVPAVSASIGITDKILTRLATQESVSKMQSAFMIDLQQIARALRSCTSRSLLLIDEFGKGTDSCDGAALAASILEQLLGRGIECPKVLASTHFHEIFENHRFDELDVAFAHMEVRVDRESAEAEDAAKIVYLYNKRPGRSTASYGAQCAAINGIHQSIVDRAEALTRLALEGGDLVAACAVLPEGELQEYVEAERVARAFVELDLDEPLAIDKVMTMLDQVNDLSSHGFASQSITNSRM